MKLKIYSIALITFIGMVACSTAIYAQTTSAQSPAPAASANSNGEGSASSSLSAPRAYSYSSPGVYDFSPDINFSHSQDTAYLRKMRKLQEQQREIQKQMQELRNEENKKNNTDTKDRVSVRLRDMNVRLRDMNVRLNTDINVKFDSAFNKNFTRSFSNSFKFNNESSDADIEKKVQSGEVKEKIKNYTKSYPADGNDKLEIDNRYGKVTVATWAKKEFKVDVQIKAYANDDAEAQKILDQTNITDSKENNVVSFETVIDGSKSWWGTMTNNGKTTVRKTVVSYTVYMPVKSAVSITNRYGLIQLPTLEGKVTINNTYGGLIAQSLTNSDINVKYGAANIISLAGSDLNLSYGSLKLDAADNLNAVINHSPAKIGKLSTSGNITVRYEGLEIGDVDKNLKTLSISTSFAPVKLGSLNDMNADFDVTTHYADFIYNNSTNVTYKTPTDEKGRASTKNYKGHIGKGNADKVITVKSNYGSVKFD